jgi:hypothetical protein
MFMSMAGIAAGTRTSGVLAKVSKRLGYTGNKRYLQLKLIPVGTATCTVAASAILFNPTVAPTSNP